MSKKVVLSWRQPQLPQTHKTNKRTLLVSGCSFTDTYGYTDHPRTWAGYLCCRAGFDRVIDVSKTASGNEYIAMSVVNQIESMTREELDDCIVIIVWSGIARKMNLKYEKPGDIDNVTFERSAWEPHNYFYGEALLSWKNIMMMQNYLENKRVSFGFSFFINTFDPPFLPKREENTVYWPDVVTKDKVDQLRNCAWIHDHKQCLFEYCFANDLLSEDLYHPNMDGYLSWTDQVLIPGLVNQGFLEQVDQ
jgi:hypothetical protein